MLKHLTAGNVLAGDHDAALAFHIGTLGLQVREEVTVPEMGNFGSRAEFAARGVGFT